jgi:hypothetical protein
MPGELVLDLAYALKVTGPSDEYFRIADVVEVATAATFTPGSFLVDLIPLCKSFRGRLDKLLIENETITVRWIPAWVPGAGFQRKAAEWRKVTTEMFCRPYEVPTQSSLANSN